MDRGPSRIHADLPAFLRLSPAQLYKTNVTLANRERRRHNTKPCNVGLAEENRDLNRYTGVVAYDTTRVKLAKQEAYINASWIKETQLAEQSSSLRTYIASQGPLSWTRGDFLSLFLDLTPPPKIVIMLTAWYDHGREKCATYIPPHGETWSLPTTVDEQDLICITNVSSTPYYATTTSTTTNNDRLQDPLWKLNKLHIFRADQKDNPAIVDHVEFLSWPDHGLPDLSALMELIAWLESWSPNRATDPPILVHCSAGVGRTGTLIVLCNLLAQLTQLKEEFRLGLLNEERDVVAEAIDAAREQRIMMVESQAQVDFVREAFRKAWESQG